MQDILHAGKVMATCSRACNRCLTVCDVGHHGMVHLLFTCIFVQPGKCAPSPHTHTQSPSHPPSCISCCCRGNRETLGGYTLTRLTSLLSTLMASPGATARFAKAGLLGEALLSIAGLSAVEISRSHLSGQCFDTFKVHVGLAWQSPMAKPLSLVSKGQYYGAIALQAP